MLLRRMLERDGHTVVEAATLPAAVAQYSAARPDVVLLDLMLEDGVSGLDVLAALRCQEEAVKVVFATADMEDAIRLRLLAAGAHGVLRSRLQPRR